MRIASRITLALPLSFAALASLAQSGCPNLGFESGTFTGWIAGTGWCCPINCGPSAPIAGRHTIMTGAGTDALTGGAVPVVAPGGGNYSVRLGNSNVNSEAERLSYTMLVDASNSLFVYRYAVVLEDPTHTSSEQPRFEIRTFDQNGVSIGCGQYSVTASAGIPGFQTYNDPNFDPIRFKNWTTVGIDLSSNIGQTVTIEFSSGDCSLGGHFGYAYLDAYCSPLSISSEFCPGLPTAELEAPLGFQSYLWSTGETTPTITVNNPTTGQVFSCTLTSVTGCQVTLTTALTPSVVASGYSSQGNCMNNVQFSDDSQTISGPPINGWQWDFGDGGTSTLQNPVHSFGTPGNHTITLIVSSPAGCNDTLVQTISLLPAPVVAFSQSPVCDGVPVQFNESVVSPSPLIELRWDFGDGTQVASDPSPSHLFAASGTYQVELYAASQNGCMDSTTVSITVNPLPAVNLGPDVTVCAGVPVNLNAAVAGGSYAWNTGATTGSISPTVSGTYAVLVTLPTGCSRSDTCAVTFNPLPVWGLSNTTACILDPVVLDAGNPGCTYAWSTGQTSQAITVAGSGPVSLTITTPQNCSVNGSVNVTYAPAITVNLGPDQLLCENEQTTVDAGAFPNAQYLWHNGATSQGFTATNTGLAYVTVTNGYCVGTDTVGFVFSTLPIVQLPDATVCIEESVTLDAGNPGFAFLWSTGETTQAITVDSLSGTYSVTVTNPDGCVTVDAADLVFYPSILVDLGPDTILCRGESLTLDAGAFAEAIYQWNNGTTGRWTISDETAVLTVHVTNGYCEGGDELAMRVVEFPQPVPLTYIETCFEDPRVQLEILGSPDADLVTWAPSDTARSIVVRAFGEYITTALNQPRCAITETVRVVEHCPPRVFIPNSFTPDGDGTNDLFVPRGYNFSTVEFSLHNRWGQAIFSTEVHGEGWDGTVNGKVAQDGVYVYRLRYRPITSALGTLGNEELITGHVTVLR
jgi:gliding motility-associated-like protein